MRKAVTGKQPARLTAHPAAKSQAKEGPSAVPLPIKTLYPLQSGGGERGRWLLVWSVLGGRRPGSGAAGGGTFGRVTGSPAAGWRVGAGSRGGVREEGAASAGRGLVVGAGTSWPR